MDITLALGGGGSKGYAHIGVIRALEKMGINIKAVTGTSAGGLAAAVYAAGNEPDEIIDLVSQIRQDNLYGFFKGPGLLGTKGIRQAASQFLSEKTFSDLCIPCALTAVDLMRMEEVVMREGKVIDAVMATIAIPGIFPPKEWADLLLCRWHGVRPCICEYSSIFSTIISCDRGFALTDERALERYFTLGQKPGESPIMTDIEITSCQGV